MTHPEPDERARLAPCHHCGNQGTRDPRHTFSFDDDRNTCAVCCGACGAKGPWVRKQSSREPVADFEARAISAWNRRAPAATGAGAGEVALPEAVGWFLPRDEFHGMQQVSSEFEGTHGTQPLFDLHALHAYGDARAAAAQVNKTD